MEISIYLIDLSSDQSPRDAGRFNRLIDIILKTEIREINLVSRRPFQDEIPFLEKIPEKIFEKKGLFNKSKAERLKKQHIQVDHLEWVSFLNRVGEEATKAILIYDEDETNDLAYDGSDLIFKLLHMAKERNGTILGLKRISFSEISKFILLKGSLISEGEYQVRSAFKAGRALQSSSNLALTNRFILKPLFFKLLTQNTAVHHENAFIDSLDLWARSEPVFGCLPFQPLKIK